MRKPSLHHGKAPIRAGPINAGPDMALLFCENLKHYLPSSFAAFEHGDSPRGRMLMVGQVHSQPKLLKMLDHVSLPSSILWSFSLIGRK